MYDEINLQARELAEQIVNPNDIIRGRKKILIELGRLSGRMKTPFFNSITESDLKVLFFLYDKIFFKNFFEKNYKDKLTFRLSKRLTSAGGKTKINLTEKTVEISISSHLLFESYREKSREVSLGSGICETRLEALAAIMEHEIIHALEWIAYGDSSCSAPRFQNMASHIFSHIHFKHQLITSREKAANKGFYPGVKVEFTFQGQKYRGIVQRVTKRATVLVPDEKGSFIDRQGQRYLKFYITIPSLKKLNE